GMRTLVDLAACHPCQRAAFVRAFTNSLRNEASVGCRITTSHATEQLFPRGEPRRERPRGEPRRERPRGGFFRCQIRQGSRLASRPLCYREVLVPVPNSLVPPTSTLP